MGSHADRPVLALPDRAGRIALVIAALLDMVWVLVLVVPTGLRWPWLSFSDVEADHRPWAWLFRTAFCGADLLVAAVGGVQTARVSRWHSRIRIGWLLLALFGVASLVNDLAAMTCVPGVDADCRLTVSPVGAPLADQVHSAFSVLAVLAMLGSMIVALPVGRGRVRGLVSRLAPVWLVGELGSTIAVGGCYLADGPIAVPQSFELVTEVTWLLLLAHHLGSPSAAVPAGRAEVDRGVSSSAPRLSG